MKTFFKKLFKRGDFMTRADKWYYSKVIKTWLWSAFAFVIISWVGTNLVLCALTTNVKSGGDIIFAPEQPVTLPTGQEFNRILKKSTTFDENLVDKIIKNLTFDKFSGIEDVYYVDGVNVLKGAEKETVSAENKIYLYRTNGGADVYVLSSNKMQANPDSSYMFYLLGVTSYKFKNFDTSQVQSLYKIFAGRQGDLKYTNYTVSTASLQEEKSKFNLLATGFGATFYPPIETLDLSTWDTGNVTNMSLMFYYCTSLKTLNVSGWDTRKVTNFDYAFATKYSNEGPGENNALEELDLSSFDTRSWTGFVSSSIGNIFLFYGLNVLKTVKISDRWTLNNSWETGGNTVNVVVVPYTGKD